MFWLAARWAIGRAAWLRYVPRYLAVIAVLTVGKYALQLAVLRALGMPPRWTLGEVLRNGFASEAIAFAALFAHALRAFDSHAVDYVLKPIDAARFARAVERLRARLGGGAAPAADAQLAAAELGRQRGWSTRIAVRADGCVELVPVGDLDWIEAVGNYVCLHAGPRELILRSTLKALELRLDPGAFVRIHRGAIVNLERVQRLESRGHGEYGVTLRGGATLTATRSFSHRLRALLR